MYANAPLQTEPEPLGQEGTKKKEERNNQTRVIQMSTANSNKLLH